MTKLANIVFILKREPRPASSGTYATRMMERAISVRSASEHADACRVANILLRAAEALFEGAVVTGDMHRVHRVDFAILQRFGRRTATNRVFTVNSSLGKG